MQQRRGPRRLASRAGFVIVALALMVVVVGACSADDPASEPSAASSTETTQTTETATPTTTVGGSLAVVGTGQTACYDDTNEIACPVRGEAFSGQDGNYSTSTPSYTDNGDGTVSDNVTGLMWQQDPGDKTTYADAVAGADSFDLAGHDDWRLPTIKELFSLSLWNGVDASSYQGTDTSVLTPFIDTQFFSFEYGEQTSSGGGVGPPGGRLIDAQYVTSTVYESTVMQSQECFFGFNFADARIKCYPTSGQSWFVRHVRGADGYGQNDFTADGDGSVTDNSTGLTWQREDNGEGVDWETALSYCEALDLDGSDDWRLPDVKELQGIVDYSKSPDTSGSAALDSVFETSPITNEAGEEDYPSVWASTTLVAYPDDAGTAAYVSFGRALGYMNGQWIDVHGAGAARSDPKTGDAGEFPTGHGPQGDAIRIDNYVRCVRGGATLVEETQA